MLGERSYKYLVTLGDTFVLETSQVVISRKSRSRLVPRPGLRNFDFIALKPQEVYQLIFMHCPT